MKDVFYTILVVWIIWRIIDGLNTARSRDRKTQSSSNKKVGETTIMYAPPETQKRKLPDEGEYVDYEEIK